MQSARQEQASNRGRLAGTRLACIGMLDPRRFSLTLALLLALGAPAYAICPNGIVEPPETCDDGNVVAGDGCSPLCLLEVPNRPPVCDGAVASTDSLWPPNHQLVPVTIDGVVDPDGDPVAVTTTGISQDEPVDGSGGTCSDAEGVGTDVALVRAARSGGGDGRVYHIAFQAVDPLGAACVGTVEVCVRHDNGHGGFCGDGGPLFDSTAGVCVPDDDDCHLALCIPASPVVIGSCGDVPIVIERRFARARHLLERAATARPRRARFLTRLARVRLARLDAIVARRFGGECEIELHDMLEHAVLCTTCPVDDHPDDGHHGDDGNDDHQGNEDD